MFPCTLLKNVILLCIIKKNTTIPAHLCVFPLAILKCIRNQRSEDLIAFFNGAEDTYATDWMGGLRPDSYLTLGSSIKVAMRSAETCRYDSHFNHAN